MFASAAEYIGKEADRWEEESQFGASEDTAIGYGITPEDRTRMLEAIRIAVQVQKVGVKKLAKKARLAGCRRGRAYRRGGGINLVLITKGCDNLDSLGARVSDVLLG